MKLVGDTEVKHQIDVVINENGKRKRVLIECKDFDNSGNKVGLEIVRNFFAVIEDTNPNEAIIITCNGFTKDALKYAKAKGIKLAVLRVTTDEDLENFIMKLTINFDIISQSPPKVSIVLDTKNNFDIMNANLEKAGIITDISRSKDVYICTEHERFQIIDFIEDLIGNKKVLPENDVVKFEVSLERTFIEILNLGEIPLNKIGIEYKVLHNYQTMNIKADKVAELILKGLNDSDLLIFDKDLKSFDISKDTGEVVEIFNPSIQQHMN